MSERGERAGVSVSGMRAPFCAMLSVRSSPRKRGPRTFRDLSAGFPLSRERAEVGMRAEANRPATSAPVRTTPTLTRPR
ncbi:hypothetical protein A33M_2510 [Rhodovulum sp. PH10]|nr:hypothetical protein A33M_2510 [Rhodovulum sp. PH10]